MINTSFVAWYMIYPVKWSLYTWKKCVFYHCGQRGLWMSVRSNWSSMLFMTLVSSLIFYLVIKSGVFKSPTIVRFLSISPVNISVFALYIWVLLFQNWLLFTMDWFGSLLIFLWISYR
jgi:hypothetical protein